MKAEGRQGGNTRSRAEDESELLVGSKCGIPANSPTTKDCSNHVQRRSNLPPRATTSNTSLRSSTVQHPGRWRQAQLCRNKLQRAQSAAVGGGRSRASTLWSRPSAGELVPAHLQALQGQTQALKGNAWPAVNGQAVFRVARENASNLWLRWPHLSGS